MPITKTEIFENINTYRAQELKDFIRQGIVTKEELYDSDLHSPLAAPTRHDLEALLNESIDEDREWQTTLLANTVDSYNRFISEFPNSRHIDEARQRINDLMNKESIEEDDRAWSQCSKDNIKALKQFKKKHPHSRHLSEANHLIDKLTQERWGTSPQDELDKIINTSDDNNRGTLILKGLREGKFHSFHLLEAIKNNHNVLPADSIKTFIDNRFITKEELAEECGISADFIKYLGTPLNVSLPAPSHPLTQIDRTSTEVYFWGVPNSGKSCVYSAVLSAIGEVCDNFKPLAESNGYNYMMNLMEYYRGDGVTAFMGRTNRMDFYEMGTEINMKDGTMYPVTFIDLSGELLRIVHEEISGVLRTKISQAEADAKNEDYEYGEVSTETQDKLNLLAQEVDVADTLTKVLRDNRSTNQKLHFFVVEYGAENRLYEGYSQMMLLTSILNYIDKIKVFQKDTVGVYIILTKADKIKDIDDQKVKEYFTKSGLRNFHNGLRSLCRENSICDGKVGIIPFTMGEVCFLQYCKHDSEPAKRIVRHILSVSPKAKKRRKK